MVSHIAIFALLSICHLGCASDVTSVEITVDWDQEPVGKVDKKEFSVNWSTWMLGDKVYPGTIDLNNESIQRLIKDLGPSYWRTSGTTVNGVEIIDKSEDIYVPIPPDVKAVLKHQKEVNTTYETFDQLIDFLVKVDSELVLGFNQLLRDWPNGQICTGEQGSCPWIDTNARPWIQHMKDTNAPVFGFELGNEPGCYMQRDYDWEHSTGITPDDAAADFAALKSVVEEVYKGTEFIPKVLGPDTGG